MTSTDLPPTRPDTPIARVRARFARMPANLRGAVWMLMAATGFSVMAALIKLLGQRLDSLQITFFRNGCALVFLLPLVAIHGTGVLRTRYPLRHGIRIITGTGAMFTGFYAITHLPLATATAISFATPLFMILMGVLLLGERVRWRRWTATGVGFLGVIIMVRPGAAAIDIAMVAALANAALVAASQAQVKTLPAGEGPLRMLLLFSVAATVITAIPAMFVWQWPTGEEWALAFGIGALGAVSQGCVIRAFLEGEATFVSPFDYTRLLMATFLGYLLFMEVPDVWTFAGAFVVIGSAIYIAHRESRLRLEPKGSRPEP